jgi:hypothetical protein
MPWLWLACFGAACVVIPLAQDFFWLCVAGIPIAAIFQHDDPWFVAVVCFFAAALIQNPLRWLYLAGGLVAALIAIMMPLAVSFYHWFIAHLGFVGVIAGVVAMAEICRRINAKEAPANNSHSLLPNQQSGLRPSSDDDWPNDRRPTPLSKEHQRHFKRLQAVARRAERWPQ